MQNYTIQGYDLTVSFEAKEGERFTQGLPRRKWFDIRFFIENLTTENIMNEIGDIIDNYGITLFFTIRLNYVFIKINNPVNQYKELRIGGLVNFFNTNNGVIPGDKIDEFVEMVYKINTNIERYHIAIENEYNIHNKHGGDTYYGFTSNNNVLLQNFNELYEHEKMECLEYSHREKNNVEYIGLIKNNNESSRGVYIYIK